MSAENKKLLWIAIAVVAVVLVLAGTAVAFFYPRKGAASAPATIKNTAAPKAADPQDYLSAPQLVPAAPAPTGSQDNGDVIVIYGDKPPALGSPSDPEAAIAATAAAATTVQTTQPAAASPGTAPAPKPVATPPKTVPKPTPTPVPTKTVARPIPAAQQYWIQAGAFSSRGKADELKDALGKKGLSGLVTVTEIKGKTWYRVRVGPYASNSEASGWLTKVKAIPGCEEAGIWKGSAATK